MHGCGSHRDICDVTSSEGVLDASGGRNYFSDSNPRPTVAREDESRQPLNVIYTVCQKKGTNLSFALVV